MKTFINTKIGYSCGVYGCTGEYFKLVIINEDKNVVIHYQGMYGVEDRVSNVLKDEGYTEIYTGDRFGQLKGNDKKGFSYEAETIQAIKDWLNK